MRSCMVLSSNIVLCWRHLSILLGHAVLESHYSQNDSEVTGKPLSTGSCPFPSACLPLFAFAANRDEASVSSCHPCGLKSLFILWWICQPDAAEREALVFLLASSSLAMSSLTLCRQRWDPAFLLKCCRSVLSSDLWPCAVPKIGRLVPCYKLPLTSWLGAIKMLASTPIILSWFFTSFSLILTIKAIAVAIHPNHPLPSISCQLGSLCICVLPLLNPLISLIV